MRSSVCIIACFLIVCLNPLILPAQPLPLEAMHPGTLEIERNISPFVRLLGTIVETGTDEPIEGARVRFGDRQMFSGEDGLFEIDPILLGKYPLQVEMAGYEHHASVVYATPPMTTVKIVLHRKFERSPWPGNRPPDRTVALPERELVLNAPVPPPKKKPRPRAVAGAASRPGRSPGRNPETVSSRDRSHWEPEPGPSRLPRVDTSRGFATLSGRVTETKTGRPLAGVMVEVGPSMIRTDSQGKYRMENVPCNRFRVVFSRKGYLPRQQSVTVKAGGTVCNAILSPSGKPLPRRPKASIPPPSDDPAPAVVPPHAVEQPVVPPAALPVPEGREESPATPPAGEVIPALPSLSTTEVIHTPAGEAASTPRGTPENGLLTPTTTEEVDVRP